MPDSLQNVPIGYAAIPFSSKKTFKSNGAWGNWPTQIICVPKTLLVWDHQAHRGIRIELSVNQPLTPQALVVGTLCRREGAQNRRTPVPENKPDWIRRVELATTSCATTELRKVVLARSTSRRAPEARRYDAVGTHLHLANAYPSHRNFILRQSKTTFLGSSPETLVKTMEGRLKTHALAGTIAIREDGTLHGADHPLENEKLRAEHNMVVYDIVERLKPWLVGLEYAKQPGIKRLLRMAHLETPIEGERARDRSIFDFAVRLHPTPALGGLPRNEASRWLDEHEALERGYFGGAVGWFDARGDGHFAVAIRCGVIDGSSATAFAGAGIVPGSEPRLEWEETQLKMTPFLDHLVDVQAECPDES